MCDSYVCSTAKMRCSKGDKISTLQVLPTRTVFLTSEPMANISDHQSMVNIKSFGRCHTVAYPPTGAATSANHGHLTPMPCVPGTVREWKNGKNDYIIKGKAALLKSSYCQCQWGGVITLISDGQGTAILDSSKKPHEVLKERGLEERKINTESVLDGIQMVLDAAGYVPGWGAIPDLLNASIYAIRGDWVNAAMSLLAAVPGIGDLAGATKLAQKGFKVAKISSKMVKTGKDVDKASNVVKTTKSSDKVVSMQAKREQISAKAESNVVEIVREKKLVKDGTTGKVMEQEIITTRQYKKTEVIKDSVNKSKRVQPVSEISNNTNTPFDNPTYHTDGGQAKPRTSINEGKLEHTHIKEESNVVKFEKKNKTSGENIDPNGLQEQIEKETKNYENTKKEMDKGHPTHKIDYNA